LSAPPPTQPSTPSLHDALPISGRTRPAPHRRGTVQGTGPGVARRRGPGPPGERSALHQGCAVTGDRPKRSGASPSSPEEPRSAGTPEEFDEAAFEAAFAAEFGQAVEPERSLREDSADVPAEQGQTGDADAPVRPAAGADDAAQEAAPSPETRRVLAVV